MVEPLVAGPAARWSERGLPLALGWTSTLLRLDLSWSVWLSLSRKLLGLHLHELCHLLILQGHLLCESEKSLWPRSWSSHCCWIVAVLGVVSEVIIVSRDSNTILIVIHFILTTRVDLGFFLFFAAAGTHAVAALLDEVA